MIDKIAAPKDAARNEIKSKGRSFLRKILMFPANKTLSKVRIKIGTHIHMPQRQDSFGLRKPNILPLIRKNIKRGIW